MSETETEVQVATETETTPAPLTETVKGETYDAARAMRTIEQLRAEIKELKPKAKQADELAMAEQKRKEAELSEAQKLAKKLEDAEAELKKLRLDEMKRAAAAKVELPLVFADRLVGETPEELEADAKKILEALPKTPKTPAVSPTNPGAGATTGRTEAQHRAEFYGTGKSLLSPEFAKEHGGGVFTKED